MLEKLRLDYSVRDAIHGFVRYNEWELGLINTPLFQRLRRVKQLSLSDFVYPGANHNRFEHSLGVMHVASRMLERICIRNRKELKQLFGFQTLKEYTDEVLRSLQLVRLAALLHDTGHGPLSHASEAVYPFDDTGRQLKHEDYSVACIMELETFIGGTVQPLWPEPITAPEVISLLMKPSSSLGSVRKSRLWRLCKKIIDSQFDADKIDYLLRDSYHLGVRYGQFDLERVIDSLTLGQRRLSPSEAEGEDQTTPEPHLCIDEDDFHVAESVAIARYWMYEHVYFHRTRRIFDLLLLDALPRLFPQGFPTNKQPFLSDYLKLDDTTVWQRLFQSDLPICLREAAEKRLHPREVGKYRLEDLGELIHIIRNAKGLPMATDEELRTRVEDESPLVWIDTASTLHYKDGVEHTIWLRPRDRQPRDSAAKKLASVDNSPQNRYTLVQLKQRSDLVRALIAGQREVVRVYAHPRIHAQVVGYLSGVGAL